MMVGEEVEGHNMANTWNAYAIKCKLFIAIK